MNRTTFDAMLAQYKRQDVSGDGAVSWDNGVRCVMPEVVIYGKAVQDGTPTPNAPIMPTFSEGTEVVCRGRNLFDKNDPKQVQKIYPQDSGIAASTITSTVVVPCFPNTVYTTSKQIATSRNAVYCCPAYPVAGGQVTALLSDAKNIPLTVKTTDDAAYLLFVVHNANLDGSINAEDVLDSVQIELGTTTEYTPYHDGGTAVAPELLAIPGADIRDEWNPQTGKGVRRVGAIRLSSDIRWKYALNTDTMWCSIYVRQEEFPGFLGNENNRFDTMLCNYIPYRFTSDQYPIRSDLGFMGHGDRSCALLFTLPADAFSDVEVWKQFLDNNEVYVYYPLAEPVPFATDPMPLIQPKGTGRIIQTGGNVADCPITAKPVTHS